MSLEQLKALPSELKRLSVVEYCKALAFATAYLRAYKHIQKEGVK